MLKLTYPMMHGPAVKRLQEKLGILNENIEIDGIYGRQTEKTIKKIQWRSGIREDGVYGTKTARMLDKLIDAKYRTVVISKSEIIDISDRHLPPRLGRPNKFFAPDGVTLHQTGCDMSRDPMGWSRVNAHYGLTQEGLPILINKPIFIWHAQGLSRNTLGVEIEGNYYGVEDVKWTLWHGGGGPHSLNAKMISGAMTIMKDIQDRLGNSWKYLYAHRQSHPTKVSDPGEQIWKQIAAPWIELAGLGVRPQTTFGKGNTLPREWGYKDSF